MRKKDKPVDPIPDEFSSYDEADEFWDKHDTTDYPNAFEDVEVKTELRKRNYEIEVDEDVMKALQKKAKTLGVPASRLASNLLRQHISSAS